MFDFDFELWKYVYTYDIDNMFQIFKKHFDKIYHIQDTDRESFSKYIYDITS